MNQEHILPTYCRKSAPHSAHISFMTILCSQTSSKITACLKYIDLVECIAKYGMHLSYTEVISIGKACNRKTMWYWIFRSCMTDQSQYLIMYTSIKLSITFATHIGSTIVITVKAGSGVSMRISRPNLPNLTRKIFYI